MSVITATAQPAPTPALKQLVTQHPIVAYFVLAFAGSWLVELPVVLSQAGLGLLPVTLPFLPFFVLMPFTGPALAAFVMAALTDGKLGISRLLRRYVQWRVAVPWYLLVLFGPPLILLMGASALYGMTPLQALIRQWPLILSGYLAGLPLTLVLGGPLGEEPGWRGFALPRLQQRYGALLGTLVLGTLHGLWHFPLFLVAGAYAPLTVSGFLLFVLGVICNAIIWTWVFNHTGGSLLTMILLHTAVNSSGGVVEPLLPVSPLNDWIPIIAYGGCAALLILFTRGRLGYTTRKDP
jgi:membrane protease YdiL (CAAX protease family)